MRGAKAAAQRELRLLLSTLDRGIVIADEKISLRGHMSHAVLMWPPAGVNHESTHSIATLRAPVTTSNRSPTIATIRPSDPMVAPSRAAS